MPISGESFIVIRVHNWPNIECFFFIHGFGSAEFLLRLKSPPILAVHLSGEKTNKMSPILFGANVSEEVTIKIYQTCCSNDKKSCDV